MNSLILTKSKWLPLCFMLMVCYAPLQLLAQGKSSTVKGIVQDEKGIPLAGVSVIAKNVKTNYSEGSQTDSTGVFRFNNLPTGGPYNFIFSFVGHESQTLSGYTIKSDASISIVIKLKELENTLDQVVVVGYGSQKKKDLTGAIGSIRPNEKEGLSVVSPDQMLQGKVSGINVTNSSGMPGAGVRVSIRGIGSINGSNEPLYVIDGVPVSNSDPSPLNSQNFGGGTSNPLSTINPDDIESIDILKDAAAASIYGSRATNGVVIITTKHGKDGRTDISFNSYTGIQNLPRKIPEANTIEYFTVLNEARNNYNLQYNLTPGMAAFLAPLSDPRAVKIPDTDWVGLVTNKNAPLSNYDLSIRGGDAKTKFYASLNYFNQEGIIKTNKFQRFSVRLNLDHKISERISIGFTTALSSTIDNRVPSDVAGNAILMRALEQRPYDVPYKADGTYSIGGVDILRHNGVQVLNEETSINKIYRALATLNATVKIAKGLAYKPSVSTDVAYYQDYLYYTKNHPYGKPLGVAYDYRNLGTNILIENLLTYDKTFGKLVINAVAGHSYQKYASEESYIDGRDFPSPAFGYISSAARINQAYTNWTAHSLESYLSRVNLSYYDKYLFSIAVRRDGSSRFATNKQYGTFPSVSAAWRLSQESFFKQANWLSNLKLRASYGLTGNQEGIGDFSSFPLTTGGNNYNQQIGLAVTQIGNQNLVWEKANQTDIGVDADLFNYRLSFVADYFIKNTNDLLFNLPVPSTTGFTTQTLNIGSMQNKGFEFGVSSKNLVAAFKWNTSFNISFIKNKVTKLNNNAPIPTDNYHILQVGQSVGTFYMLKQIGIYQSNAEIPAGLFAQGVRAGDVKFQDVNNDGLINSADRQVVGNSTPDFFGGLTNTFSYKHFDLNIFATFSHGNKIFSYWRGNSYGDGIDGVGGNQFNMLSTTTDGRWQGAGTSNSVPRAIWPTANGNYNKQISTRFLENGSYFRIKNITLGYTFQPKNMAVLKNIRLYVGAQNLLTITKYMGYDPEVSYLIDPRNMGLDAGTVPQLKSFMVGLNAKF
jgi:TonB-linked SusC/RagA family outer membrane protein